MGLLLLLVATAVAAQPRGPTAEGMKGEKRVALVIGNSQYKESPLKNPVNDATDMATALRELAQSLKGGGVGLFYFAGHGVQSKGRNFLIPIDASIESEAEVEDESVDANLVLSYMEDAQNRVNIVVLDACRNNPFTRSFRSASQGLAQMDAAKGTFLAFATAPGMVAADGDGRNGLFTKHLLASLQHPDSKLEDVFKRVRVEVAQESSNRQIPWDASSLTGDFYFHAPGASVTATPAAPPTRGGGTVDPVAIELAFWDSIKASSNRADFEEYLRQYPQGRFAGLARNRMTDVAAVEPADRSAAPDIAGTWRWSVRSIFVRDRINVIRADGTCTLSDGTPGTWILHKGAETRIDFFFENKWTGQWIHKMTLSPDEQLMSGTNNWGVAVTAIKTSRMAP